MSITALVDTETGQFLVDGKPREGARFQRVPLPRNPGFSERYTGDPDDPFRPATAQELAAETATSLDVQADRQEIDLPPTIRAVLITQLWGRLGRQPTAQELQTERTRYKQILRSLL